MNRNDFVFTVIGFIICLVMISIMFLVIEPGKKEAKQEIVTSCEKVNSFVVGNKVFECNPKA